MNIAHVFGTAANDYDLTRRKYIACYDDFYGVALSLIPYQRDDAFRLLDLGAGTGLVGGLVRAAFPFCDITLADISAEMLDKARERFDGDERVRFVQHDYVNDQPNEELQGEYDVVISALSLHHSTAPELKSVVGKIYACLSDGGIFINADQILGRTPDIERAYEAAWLAQARAGGCTQEEIDVALRRMQSDRTLPLASQLGILEDCGFACVNCWYQYYRFAVYSGIVSIEPQAK